MKHVDKKLSDDFTKYLNEKLFYKNGKPLKQTKNKLKFFNECTTALEEFINSYVDKPELASLPAEREPEPTSSLSRVNKNVMKIVVRNPIAAEHGCTVMTPSESMKADESLKNRSKK